MVSFAAFEGQLCDDDDMAYDDDYWVQTGIVPEHVESVFEYNQSEDENPLTEIRMIGVSAHWYVVKGTVQQTIDALRGASKRL